MSSNDDTIRGRSSVRPMQSGTPVAAGEPASALASLDPILVAQRLDSSQPPNGPKIYRDLSPSSLFPRDGGSLHAGNPPFDPSVHERHHVEENSAASGSNVSPEEKRVKPLQVKHTDANEKAVKLLEPHLRSMVCHYCGDSEEAQVRFLELILKHHGEICRLERKARNGGPGGVKSIACVLCPPTSGGESCCFNKANAVRSFAEHVTHDHLHIPNPFICVACGKCFPYSQDRDRHERQVHKMYRPKAWEALLKRRAGEQRGRSPISTDDAQSPAENNGPAEVNAHRAIPPNAYLEVPTLSQQKRRSRTPLPNRRVGPYPHARTLSLPSTHQSSRGGDRAISHSGPFDNGMLGAGTPHPIHAPSFSNNYPDQPGTGTHALPPSTSQSYHDFETMHASLDGRNESRHTTREIHSQKLPGQHWAQRAMPQMGPSMHSQPRLIGPTMTPFGYQDLSVNLQSDMQYNSAELRYEHSQRAQTEYEPLYNDTQNHMPLPNRSQYQHDSYALSGLPYSHHPLNEYGGSTMYQAHQQQSPPQRETSAHDAFQRNMFAPTPSPIWPGAHGVAAMPYMTPHPAPVPGLGLSSPNSYYTHVTPAHDANTGVVDAQTNHGFSRSHPSDNPYNTSHYSLNGMTYTSQYSPPYDNTNNIGPAWGSPPM